MTGRGQTFQDRMRARRERMKETSSLLSDGSDGDLTTRPQAADDTWNAAMEDDNVQSIDNLQGTSEEEEKQSEHLVKTLQKKRKKTEKELSRALESQRMGDVTAQLMSAKKKTRERIEAKKQEEEEELADTVESTDAELMSLGRPPTGRSAVASPSSLEDSQTPRRLGSTLSQSLRARLSEKLRAAKDKGKDEAYDESKPMVGRRLDRKRHTPRVTRFDDPSQLRDEDLDNEDYVKSLLARSRWKQASKSSISEPSLTPEMQFDFFTRIFEPVEEDRKSEKDETEVKVTEREEGAESPTQEGREEGDVEEAGVPPQREEEPTEEETPAEPKQKDVPEERQLLIDEVEEIAKQWLSFEMSAAEYEPFRERIKAEKEIYFIPSMRQAPVSAKMPEDKPPRNLEEEGIYVGVRPPVPQRNVNKMENRLLGEANKSLHWFGEGGELLALPDPVKEISSRPVILEEVDPAITFDYVRAAVSDFDMHFIETATDGRGRFQLDVDINTLVFQHHHLFSREHVLATQLTQQYQHYMWRSQKQLVKFLRQKLTAVKRAEKHVQDSLARITKEKRGDNKELQFRLTEYQDEIKLTRHTLEAEMRADRILLKNIIKTWKEIKSLRDTDKCINTSLKLIIKKEPTNKAADTVEWERDVEEEVEEVKREVEEEHRAAMALYREKLDVWKAQRARKKEAKKRQKQRAKRPESETETNQDIEQAEKDRAILDEFEITKPEKPQQVTAADLRDRILQKYDEIRRKPGEPMLYPELSNGASITTTKECPSKEQQRRADVNRYKVYVRITFNNKEVSRTPARLLGQDFTVHFAQIFNVEIVQWPESIKIEIFETAGMTSTLLAEVYAPIPDVNMTGDNVLMNELEFSSSQKMSHSHAGVGSDVQMTFAVCEEDQQVATLLTSGTLTTSVSWAVSSDGKALVPPVAPRSDQLQGAMAAVDIISALGMAGMTDMDKLIKWISQARLDPNDPSNADLMYLLRPVGGGDGMVTSLQLPEHYRLDQLQAEFDFVTDKFIEASRRFRLIQYREREIPDFKNKAMIPAFDWEISEDVFSEYEKKLAGEDKLKKMDEINSHRIAVSLFVQKMREDLLMRLRLATHHKVLSDMVYEDAVPNIATLIPSLMKLFEPRRPLKPIRKKRKKVTPQSQQNIDIKILVNIVHAYDIPVRAEAMASGGGGGQPMGQSMRAPPTTSAYPRESMSPRRSVRRVHHYHRHWECSEMFLQVLMSLWDCVMQGFTCLQEAFTQLLTAPLIAFQADQPPVLQTNYSMYNTSLLGIPLPKPDMARGGLVIPNPVLVRPFVEVVFQKTSQQTSVGDGPNPTWNEELQLPFKARNDDYSTANLQTMRDAVYFNLFDEVVVDMVQDERERTTSIHRRIEKRWLGSLTIPFSTIYANSRVDGTFRVTSPPILLGYTHATSDNLGMMTEMDQNQGNHTYLSMFITIEPPLTPPEAFIDRFDSSEDEKLLSYAATWQTALQKKFTARHFTTTVVDISGKSVFVTRYFRPLRPPEELLKDTTNTVATAELVARFVSLIPFMSDSIIFAGLFDIWGTCEQFLRMLQGDEDEHAVLLVNYFLHLEKKAWLLLGTAIPEGRTAYVITQEGGDYWIWNASTGEHFRRGDSHCPVTAIHCLVNSENIWANIQPHCQPCRMQFDLTNSKNWKPFFCRAFPNPGLSSVQPAQLLYYPTDKSYVIDLQDRIETTLKRKVMDWRPRSITRWNRYCMKTFRTLLVELEEARGHGLQQKHCDELEKVLGAYKMTGFPINMPDSELDMIVEAVYATGVHNTENRDVEFALAVHVHPYPNSVLSIWIYIASLVKKSSR